VGPKFLIAKFHQGIFGISFYSGLGQELSSQQNLSAKAEPKKRLLVFLNRKPIFVIMQGPDPPEVILMTCLVADGNYSNLHNQRNKRM
jgi:hypothetical protein